MSGRGGAGRSGVARSYLKPPVSSVSSSTAAVAALALAVAVAVAATFLGSAPAAASSTLG